ncbi:methyltransferase, FxLD system [Streptomyces europaeiscabiei]|uniref:methyltransferase, FxLD system n=1 Tax=Streptomyces europaeiscabiei TaxID=146819 RepID=UPI0029BDB974|nr:methyltransferase, FxLD system [Streptomyces europaeiscabiei]MDX3867648.1 methyltransferase, FxLD system [Streptomyces europaeiscabiei]MDX3871324.1 methyltransferase, FxLD system [Streptomyces europaeiscabiei]
MNDTPAPKSEKHNAPASEQQLRDAMVERLIELGAVRSARVVAAFRSVPRHLATPEVDTAKTYEAEFAAITKTDPTGVHISSVSAPRIQAMQIEQADIQPGMSVLEIGSGGVNAAYLAEMVGERGHVVTMDIDHDVTRRAEDFLKATGYDRIVTVITADGEHGVPGHAPYDRIVVTVQAADIPPAWVHQLKEGGRLVVPLRMRGMTRTVAFVRDRERLVSDGFELCGFVPMQGVGENRVRLVLLHDVEGEEIALRLDGHPEPDAEALRVALGMPRVEAWSGVTVAGDESTEHLDLWLTTALDNLPLMAAKIGARKRGLVASASPIGVPTLVDGDSFAYRTARPTDDPDRYELGAIRHGPQGQKVADRLVEEIQVWHSDHRAHRAHIEVHPAGTPDDRLPAGRLVDRPHTRVTITWP